MIFFLYGTPFAVKKCDESIIKYNITPENCRTIVTSKLNVCSAKLKEKSPEYIKDKATSISLGKEYLECISP